MFRARSRMTSESRTPNGGLVAEATLGRTDHREISRQAPETDQDDADLETLLGDADDIGSRLASLRDADTDAQEVYKRTCLKWGLVPISTVMRKMGDSELNLRNHQCGPQGARAVALLLCFHQFLTKLDMGCNQIEDEGIRAICDCLGEKTTINHLSLAQNRMTLIGLRDVCRLVIGNTHLVNLDISGNHLGDKSAKLLGKVIEATKTLKYLDLSNTNLGVQSGMEIGRAIGTNISLQELDLSWNHIRLDGAAALANGIKENTHLRRVNLGWNGFGQETSGHLASCLGENGSVTELDLAGNRLTDEAMLRCVRGLETNTTLQKLVITQNSFTNVGAFALISAIQTNKDSALNFIDMRNVTVREDFLELLSDLQCTRTLEVLHNVISLRPHLPDPLEVLLSHLAECNLQHLFNLTGAGSDQRALVPKETFVDKLKALDVPLSNQQLNQIANTLMNDDIGLLDLSRILETLPDSDGVVELQDYGDGGWKDDPRLQGNGEAELTTGNPKVDIEPSQAGQQ